MKLRKYNKFSAYLLLESHLQVDPLLVKIINLLRAKSPVAKRLSALINKDIKTNVNYLALGKANDEISFTNDKQIDRIVKSGGDPFEKGRGVSKIGRVVRQILTANEIEVTDKDIEVFVNLYKAEWDHLNSPGKFEIVSGDKIKDWYLESKYTSGGGTLNNSCMRYDTCQEYFDLYTTNPEVCQLVILKTDDDQKLLGRAILWKCNTGADYYLDRIYTTRDYDEDKILKWVESKMEGKNLLSFKNSDPIKEVTVKVTNAELDYYPYMDSLSCLNINKKILKSIVDNKNDLFYVMRNTEGSKEVRNYQFSNKHNKYFRPSEVTWVATMDDYLPLTECIKAIRGEYIFKETAVYCDLYKGYCDPKDVIKTEKWGPVPRYEIVHVHVDDSGKTVQIPKAALGDKYVAAMNQSNQVKYIRKELSFVDIIGNRFIEESKKPLLENTNFDIKLNKMIKIGPRGIYRMKDIFPRANFFGGFRMGLDKKLPNCQVWALNGTDIPVAIEYQEGEDGIFSPTLFVESFRLEKISSDIFYIQNRNMMYDMYENYPIGKLDKIPTEEAKNYLNEVDKHLYRRSGKYILSKSILMIKDIPMEERYRQFNKVIFNFWMKSKYFKKWIINFRTEISKAENAPTLNRMLSFFNRLRPFGINRRYSPSEFIDWFATNMDKFLCVCFIWTVVYDREGAGPMAGEILGDVSPNTIRWLTENTFSENGGSFGDDIYSAMDDSSGQDLKDGHDGNLSRWARNYFMETDPVDASNINENEDPAPLRYKNTIKLWEMFAKEDLPKLFDQS